MTIEELIKQAKELGISDSEIEQFIKNEAIAKKYGIDDEYTSINVKIDKNINLNKELDKSKDECHHCDDDCECDCDCDECHCHHHYH